MMNIHKELPLSFPGLSTLPGPLTPFYTNIATLPLKPLKEQSVRNLTWLCLIG